RTSSAGRLFDAVAALAGLRDRVSFEGQAAMELEFAAAPGVDEFYEYAVNDAKSLIVDWEPMVREIIADSENRVETAVISAKFHNALVEMIVHVARRVGEPRVLLTGGCFQNRYLTERAVRRLRENGFSAYWHQRIPPNDGGIALGQSVAAVYDRRIHFR